MITTKKLQPLSFSIEDFLTHYPDGTTDLTYPFPSFPVIGKLNVTFQLIFQELNASDLQIKLEQSLDNTNFDDLVDTAGNPILMTLPKYQNSVTITLSNINTAYIRCKLILNSATYGSFTNYIYLTS